MTILHALMLICKNEKKRVVEASLPPSTVEITFVIHIFFFVEDLKNDILVFEGLPLLQFFVLYHILSSRLRNFYSPCVTAISRFDILVKFNRKLYGT